MYNLLGQFVQSDVNNTNSWILCNIEPRILSPSNNMEEKINSKAPIICTSVCIYSTQPVNKDYQWFRPSISNSGVGYNSPWKERPSKSEFLHHSQHMNASGGSANLENRNGLFYLFTPTGAIQRQNIQAIHSEKLQEKRENWKVLYFCCSTRNKYSTNALDP